MPSPIPITTPVNPGTDPVVGFYNDDASRVRNVVLYVEGMIKSGSPRTGNPKIMQRALVRGYCSGGATATGGSSAGTFQICMPGTLSVPTGSPSYPFDNLAGALSGPFYGIFGWADGSWTLLLAPCSS